MRDCLEVTEARQWMIMRALDDMVANKHAAVSTTDPKDTRAIGIDWEHYKAQYLMFQEELRKEEAVPPPAEEDIPADAVVFGGEGG